MARPRTIDDPTVLAAAARAMAEKGPARLTLGDVAAQAGLSSSTLLQRFGSKRGLLLAVCEAASPDARRRFAAVPRDGSDRLEALLGVFVDLVGGITREAMANHIAFLGIDVGDPEFRALAAAQAADLRDGAAALLSEAIEAGELHPASDPITLARAVHVTFNGSLIAWALDGDGALGNALESDLRTLLTPYRTTVPA
ncbi:MAG: TetR/AcrR family transcriptional regulator [Solirubrobacteraceae bacterium]